MHRDDPSGPSAAPAHERYPGYDVLAKQATPSWNAVTRKAVMRRLNTPAGPRYLSPQAYGVLQALCDRILPQPPGREPVRLADYADDKLVTDRRDGYRHAAMPPQREAWSRGLAALDAEAMAAHGAPFAKIAFAAQDALIGAMQAGDLHDAAWGDMPCALFFTQRVISDITRAYYAHPTAWNEIGFGGPASPRGYVRMDFDKRDPWEAAEAVHGREAQAAKANARVGR